MNLLLGALRAVAEPTRFRLIALCAEGEFTVSELLAVLGQSQPRVSRHLKLLAEAGLLERFREGSWVFHRLKRDGPTGDLARTLVAMVPGDDNVIALDRQRLARVKEARAEKAAAYFSKIARQWDALSALHIDESEVEGVLRGMLSNGTVRDLLDVGTGTGRMLQLLGPQVDRAAGIDLSPEMLAVARANLETSKLTNCLLRKADMHNLPFAPGSFDAVTIHQVLHFADHPEHVIAEAARVLRPDGRVVVVDFAPHELEYLRTEHEHRRLGFDDAEVAEWFATARLETENVVHLPGDKLTTTVWLGAARDAAHDPRPDATYEVHPGG
ncbi:MAG: metalloregulator ArsR/SmtB family transcription factor [Rhodospirillales bacterium]|jgi:ArsR family transcriptional regulator|nr:metalloregulator ArsR/SmtB family transcription factor [Rhodospirillales bacterium]